MWYLLYSAKSPDLNPIKYFWLKLKELLHRLHPELKTMGGGAKQGRISWLRPYMLLWLRLMGGTSEIFQPN